MGVRGEMGRDRRFGCGVGSAALLGEGLAQAMHDARDRQAFGRALADHALMRRVLVDLALESEAATVLSLRLARVLDPGPTPVDRAWGRVLIPAAKFWVCKRTIQAVAECIDRKSTRLNSSH